MMKRDNEYTRQAVEFLKKHDAKMTITLKGIDETGFNRYGMNYLYRVRIDRNHKTFSFDFHDSVNNCMNNMRPTAYDVLACLEKYEVPQDVWDFADTFGYQIDCKEEYNRVSKIHKAVMKEYNNVVRLFGDCLEELQDIC